MTATTRGRPRKPCSIDGRTFPTTTLAAAFLGISPTTLASRFQRLGTRHIISSDLIDRRKNPVEIRGVHYPSQTLAAAALGITAWSLYRAIEQGRLDTVGLGRRRRHLMR